MNFPEVYVNKYGRELVLYSDLLVFLAVSTLWNVVFSFAFFFLLGACVYWRGYVNFFAYVLEKHMFLRAIEKLIYLTREMIHLWAGEWRAVKFEKAREFVPV